ncbi:MAG: hypothetical protein QNJ70_15690 [Xenococcaceae cyanobacterium MO_207.B15]|nr:hypothetical protein [Xenococcaceae cyanobacterium MO_207.B15]
MEISPKDFKELKTLEECLWQRQFRFDLAKMNDILAPDFFEYGRSGRVYQREDTISIPKQEIRAVIPLVNFKARLIDVNVVQITYVTHHTP